MADTPNRTIPPQNSDAEASLLGSILIDSDAIVKIADLVSFDDFYDEKNRRIYEAIITLYEQHSPIDILTLSNKLSEMGFLETVGGASYLTELTNYVPTALHVNEYAEIVAQKALRRRLIKASQDIVGYGYDETVNLQDLIENAESRLFEVSQRHVKQDVTSLESILTESFDRLDALHKDKNQLRGIPTGYKDLDDTLAGLQRSDLIVLAARPSMGKTAMSLNIARNVALEAKQPVLIFSLEMSKDQLVDRMLAMTSGVDAWALRTGNLSDRDFEKIGQAMGTLSEAEIYIDDTPSITVSELRTKARRIAHSKKIGLVIVDYLQLMSGSSRFGNSEGNRVQEVSEISRGLKGIARELNVPVLALSQLSRSVENRSPQIPQLADLRESGCLAGDTLIYLPEEGIYKPIKDFVKKTNLKICALDTTTYKLHDIEVASAFSTGIKKIYRLTTSTGRTIRATGNHKFLTIFGWKRLDNLNADNFIAVPRQLPNYNNLKFTHSEIIPHVSKTELLNQVLVKVMMPTDKAIMVNDILWDQIISIEPDGIDEVFDLTIPNLHNFVAADIIVHNSIEQDSDVVAFIYREEVYNENSERKNIADILIKKHRNGPTRNIELYFDREKQLFRSVDTKHSQPFD